MDRKNIKVSVKTKVAINTLQNFVLQGGAGSGKTETLKDTIDYVSSRKGHSKITPSVNRNFPT